MHSSTEPSSAWLRGRRGIDPGSFVLLGLRTSDMSKEEMSALIELIHAFGAEHNVTFYDGVAAA